MLNREYQNFDCKRFEADFFENNQPDPYHQRLKGIRTWRDMREYFGLSSLRCDEPQLRQGYMSKPLHEALERKIGVERLASYFPKPQPKKLGTDDKDIEELSILLWGSVGEVNAMRNKGK